VRRSVALSSMNVIIKKYTLQNANAMLPFTTR
jgi:hypothetical protein